MTDDPKRKSEDSEEEADAPDGVDEENASADAAQRFGLSDKGLGTQWFMVADEEIKETFGADALIDMQTGRARWAARFSGEGLDGPSADPLKTAALLRRIAMTARWISNGLFPGRGSVPGFVLGEATHSIVLEFTLAPDERPVRLRGLTEGDEAKPDESRLLFPTVEGGRYFAALLDSTDRADEFVENLSPIGRLGVQTYEGALKELVELEAELDLVVPAVGHEGEPIKRHVHVPISRSEQGLKVLTKKPKERSETIEVEGLLYAQNSLNLGFGIKKDNDDHITGVYDLRVADKLGAAWDKRVWAQIEVIGPREEWMPRAGRTRRVLQDVVVLGRGETRLGRKKAKVS